MRTNHNGREGKASTGKAVLLIIISAIFCGVAVGLTEHLGPSYRRHLIVVEVAFFSILIVELLGRIIVRSFRERDALDLGIAVRVVLRTISYLVLSVSLVSLLAEDPALAIGVGSVTGLILGFATQTLLGNVFAGMFLAVGRFFKVGDVISVMGTTGKVTEIGLTHIKADAGDETVLIPSTAIMANVLRRKKEETGLQQ